MTRCSWCGRAARHGFTLHRGVTARTKRAASLRRWTNRPPTPKGN